MKKTALVTGITGQDGSYLTELLLSKGYHVHGLIRRASSFNTQRIDHLYQDKHAGDIQLELHYGDMSDASNLSRLIARIAPTEVYNLAAQSHVKVSFDVPEYTAQTDAVGTLRLLDAIKDSQVPVRFYQASTSEMYGQVQAVPQTETTPFYPRSPYAAAKVYAHWITVNYREAYGLHASSGILFNHESPRRGKTFVTRKISCAVANIAAGKQDVLYVGNIDAKRDWGYAPEYVDAMWRMLQQDTPDDYVIATGKTYTVRAFIEQAFSYLGMPIVWEGSGVSEVGYDQKTGKKRVCIDPAYFRPTEVELLIGDASKAKRVLGWEPRTSFEDLVALMVKADYDRLS